MANASIPLILIGVALALITAISLLIASLGRLNTDQSQLHWSLFAFLIQTDHLSVAIPYNTISKKLSREVQAAGLHLNAPGFKFIIFPSVFTSMEFDDISVCSFSSTTMIRIESLVFES